jgi:DHA1 family multidrug resistance protein-like MFS transporter
MTELIRDTAAGHFLRAISGQKVFPYPEDKDPSIWQKFVDKEKSGNLAHHGHTGPAEEDDEKEKTNESGDSEGLQPGREYNGVLRSSRNSSDTRVASTDRQLNEVSGVPVDPEKGRDATIVTWYSDTDSDVSSIESKHIANF